MSEASIRQFIETGFPFHAQLGVKVDVIEPEFVRLFIPFKPELIGHAKRAMIHGGVISSLVDICAGFAVWTRCKPEDHVSTITMSVDYLRPAPAGDVYAEAKVRLVGNRVGNARVEVWIGENRAETVAEGRGVYNIKRG